MWSTSSCQRSSSALPVLVFSVSYLYVSFRVNPTKPHSRFPGPRSPGSALRLYRCRPGPEPVLARQLTAFAFRQFKDKRCLLLAVVRRELPSVGAAARSPALPVDVWCAGAGGWPWGRGRRCFFLLLKTSWFHSAGSLFLASKILPTLMHLFANGGNCWLGNKCYFHTPTKWHWKTPSKHRLCSANVFFLPSAVNNRLFFSMVAEEPSRGCSQSRDFCYSWLCCFCTAKIKTWSVAYRLPLFTFHLLSFSALSVFQNKQCIICQSFCTS